MQRTVLILALLALPGCTTPRDGDRRDAAPAGDGTPGLVEACTDQREGSTGFDDDLDGAIDEGCPLFVGTPMPLADVHRTSSPLLSPWSSPDKLRLYLVRADLGELAVAHRRARDVPFGAPVTAARWEGVPIVAATLAEDELEVIVAAPDAALARATRPSRDAAFGALDPITLTVAPPHHHPALSSDGLELFFVAQDALGTFQVLRARRSARGAPFGPVEPAVASDGANQLTPSPSADGRQLFLSLNGALAVAERTAEGTFGVPSLLGPLGIFPHADLRTRELFFVTQGAPWSPVPAATLWRAPLCRDGECIPRPIPCPGGALSPDEQHCYVAIRTPLPWHDARADCEARGAHLITLSSADEAALAVFLQDGAPQWTGGFDARDGVPECNLTIAPEGCAFGWVGAEPWLFAPWAPGEPSGVDPADGSTADCAALAPDATLVDRACAAALPFVCESERALSW